MCYLPPSRILSGKENSGYSQKYVQNMFRVQGCPKYNMSKLQDIQGTKRVRDLKLEIGLSRHQCWMATKNFPTILRCLSHRLHSIWTVTRRLCPEGVMVLDTINDGAL